jgi:hypothetical protein
MAPTPPHARRAPGNPTPASTPHTPTRSSGAGKPDARLDPHRLAPSLRQRIIEENNTPLQHRTAGWTVGMERHGATAHHLEPLGLASLVRRQPQHLVLDLEEDRVARTRQRVLRPSSPLAHIRYRISRRARAGYRKKRSSKPAERRSVRNRPHRARCGECARPIPRRPIPSSRRIGSLRSSGDRPRPSMLGARRCRLAR